MKRTLLALLFLLATTAYAAKIPMSGKAVPSMKKFDKSFVRLMKKWHIPGASVAVVEDGQVVFSRGYGYANLKTKTTVKPDSLFRFASVSKAITAVAIAKLVEQGKLSLDDKVFEVLSDLKPLPGHHINKRLRRVRVKDLLTMTSGIIAAGKYHYDPMYGPWLGRIVKMIGYDNLPASCYDISRMMLSMPVATRPGRQFSYSNFDYCLLGMIVDKKMGKPYNFKGYEDYVNKEVFGPLDIHSMSIASTQFSNRRKKEVVFYRYKGPIDISYQGRSKNLPYGTTQILQKNFSNGGWLGSAPDLAKFVYAFSEGEIVKRDLVEKMLQRPSYVGQKTSRYLGMGWKVKKTKRGRYWYQTGSFTGTNALVLRRSNGAAIAVIFNARPPIYHMWRNFRPTLKKLLRSDNNQLLNMLSTIPDIDKQHG